MMVTEPGQMLSTPPKKHKMSNVTQKATQSPRCRETLILEQKAEVGSSTECPTCRHQWELTDIHPIEIKSPPRTRMDSPFLPVPETLGVFQWFVLGAAVVLIFSKNPKMLLATAPIWAIGVALVITGIQIVRRIEMLITDARRRSGTQHPNQT